MNELVDSSDSPRTDRELLDRARVLAHKGWGHVQPNPMVGCVLVRDGVVVGEGYHREFGGPHAEIVALEAARTHAEGATAYVSLEPCNHEGKTPPCSEALIHAGIRRVVFGASDPGTASGGGGERMRAAGVEVVGPLWSDREARAENPAFHHGAAKAVPYVALKLAMSLDGKIAAAPGRRSRITGPEAEREVHRLRTGFDALLVGAGTIRVDNPRLTVRLVPPGRRPPRRLLIDPRAELSGDASVLEGAREAPVHVFTRRDAPEGDLERLEDAGAHVHPVDHGDRGVEMAAVLAVCWELGIHSMLCEGGARLANTLLREGHVSRLYLFFAPFALGSDGVSPFGAGSEKLPWSRFSPLSPPDLHGRDALWILDREAD
jgi:diaminohydroxyphosphoribosylaminopyrimidine deaminase/5-amino-6-(5-phosphoribosylamino)uracil reductase